MQVTLEISLYPLTEQYAQVVTDFILQIRKHENIKVETNGLSTQIFGDYDYVMGLMTKEIKQLFSQQRAVFVLKLAAGELTAEKLPEELK